MEYRETAGPFFGQNRKMKSDYSSSYQRRPIYPHGGRRLKVSSNRLHQLDHQYVHRAVTRNTFYRQHQAFLHRDKVDNPSRFAFRPSRKDQHHMSKETLIGQTRETEQISCLLQDVLDPSDGNDDPAGAIVEFIADLVNGF